MVKSLPKNIKFLPNTESKHIEILTECQLVKQETLGGGIYYKLDNLEENLKKSENEKFTI